MSWIPQDISEFDFIYYEVLTRFPDPALLYWLLETFFYFYFLRWCLQSVVLMYYILTVASLISLAYFQVLVALDELPFCAYSTSCDCHIELFYTRSMSRGTL